MRTSRHHGRWLCIAIALSFASPAAFAEGKKSIADCTSFNERELDEEAGVDFTIDNKCEVKVSCGIKWTLTCAPGTKKAKKTREQVAFEIESGMSDGTTASTEACGYHGWQISDVTWSCEPTP